MNSESDEVALRRLIYGYARCCDTRDGNGFAALFQQDAVLEGPGFRNSDPEKIRAVPESLNYFMKTYHTVLNALFEVNTDTATGVIYSMAHHLKPLDDGKYSDIVMYITYHDRYARSASGWQFAARRVEMEFTENKTVDNIGTMPKL